MKIDAEKNDSAAAGWNLDDSYTRLPEEFFSYVNPTQVTNPSLRYFNLPLAEELGLGASLAQNHEAVAIFAGNSLPAGSRPIAQAYAGHQFGNFTMLGDGRAILLGEQISPSGARWDIQLKGSGPTPYSRRGDGRATMGPMLREVIIGEAMHAMGIPTTRGLAVADTGDLVVRDESLPGAVLTRVAASHIRVGTFQFAAAQPSPTGLRALLDYSIARHYPEIQGSENDALAFLNAVIDRQALLISRWMAVGFVHGVMNTDNMAISGETIDYGPCAFIDRFRSSAVFSSIDSAGRYAYKNQTRIAQWNVARLAESLLGLIHPKEESAIEIATDCVHSMGTKIHLHWGAQFRAKLGLFNEEPDDLALVSMLLEWMEDSGADFTNTFLNIDPEKDPSDNDLAFLDWHHLWSARVARQEQSVDQVRNLMGSRNPAVIPRNQRVEEALSAAVYDENFGPFESLLRVVSNPYSPRPGLEPYQSEPDKDYVNYRTFCGT